MLSILDFTGSEHWVPFNLQPWEYENITLSAELQIKVTFFLSQDRMLEHVFFVVF